MAKPERPALKVIAEGKRKPGRDRTRDKPQFLCSKCGRESGVETSHLEWFKELVAPYWEGSKLVGGSEVSGWRCKYCKTVVIERRR